MADGGDEFDIDAKIAIRDQPDIGAGESAVIEVAVSNTHYSVALNDALQQVREHPYRPGELLHEQIRYELNCAGYEVVRYTSLTITYPVADELELGDVTFEVVVCDVGILPEND